MIIFVGGLIGAGKSTVARALAEEFGLYYYDVDEVKKQVFVEDPDYEHNMQHGIPFCDATRARLYDRVSAELHGLAQQHRCIVVDETLHKRELRHKLFAAAEKHFGGYFVVWVKADEPVIIDRLKSKHRENHLLSDPLKMHNTMLEEFEDFKQNVIVCLNNGAIEDTMRENHRFFSSIFKFGMHASADVSATA